MENKNFFQRNMAWIIPVAIIVILGFWTVGQRNSFVRQNEAITGQWAQVENQYQRRFDLIPNVVNTVKGIAGQEKEVFSAIADARTRYAGATTVDQKAAAAGQVESALGRLLVITENYPTLQSSQSFRDLTVALEGTENRISVERTRYNDLVQKYNASVQIFPGSLAASIFGFGPHEYFNVSDEAQAVPTVNFEN